MGETVVLKLARLAVLAFVLAGTPVWAASSAGVVVSSKLSTESAMIGQMIRLLLTAHGIPTVDRMTLGATPVVRRALLAGEIDLYVEYTGNAGFFFNRPADPVWKDAAAGYAEGARLDLAAHQIVWLEPAPASNAWALAIREDVARRAGLVTMTDFARWVRSGGDVVLACSAEFANAGTLRSLEKTYGFQLRPNQKIVLAGGETSATIGAAAARTNGVNVAMVYATDGGIVSARLRVLEDDRHDQPIYAPVPTARQAILQRYPAIPGILAPLMKSLDRERLQRLNERVQIDGEAPASVARDYLRTQGFLP
jgi:osmoprotectant transport system substrate-binding protein